MPRSSPHILFIFSDQHRFDCLGVNKHPMVRTPNWDRLAAEGANFTHAFTPIPICVPARCSLLSGQWPSQHGVVFNFDGETFKGLDEGVRTYGDIVRGAGYRTVHVNRWHIDPKRVPSHFGFDEYVPNSLYNEWRPARGIAPAPSDKGWMGQADTTATAEQSRLAFDADQVIRQVEESLKGEKPFFIQWHPVEPHLPCRPTEPYASMYDPAMVPPWPSFSESFAGKPFIQRQMPVTWGLDQMTWDDWAPVVARYLGVITQMDHEVGRVLDALDRLGIAEDTLVIYSTDHGDLCGAHRMIDKHYVMYDDVVRVPLIMRWPRVIPSGVVVDAFVYSCVDLAPTFCEAVGAAAPATFAGESLLPLATGALGGPRSDIFTTYSGGQFGAYSQRMVRDRRWKFIWNPTAHDELYDLVTDPAELVNRVSDPLCASELARLKIRLVDWMERVRDRLLNQWTRRQLLEGRRLAPHGTYTG